MSVTTLVQLEPRRAADAVMETHRFVHNARQTGRFMGVQWQPAGIESLPDFEMDLGLADGKFGQGATPQVGQLVLSVGRHSALASMIFEGSIVTLRTAPWPAGFADAADADFSAPVTYIVDTVAVSADGLLTLTLLDMGQPLRNPLIAAKFGSTANPLLDGSGAADHAGKVVPMGWGKCLNVPALLVDRVYNIWLLIGRPTSVFHGVYDGGVPFTAGSVRADLAALRANTPIDGRCDVCGNAGGLTLVRPWTAPTYPLTADITAAGPQTAGDIALAVVAMRSAINIGDGVATAFNALYPYQAQLFINDETTAAGALDLLMAGLGARWIVRSDNSIDLDRLDFAAPVMSFAAHDLISIEREGVVMPNRRRAVGWGHNNRVHSEAEIALALLDLSGLGALAMMDTLDWALVTGAGRPETGATRNLDGGGNQIRDPIYGSDWSYAGTAGYAEDPAGTGALYNRYRAVIAPDGGSGGYVVFSPLTTAAAMERYPVVPGETMHAVWWGFRGASSGDAVFLANGYNAAGAYVGTIAVPGTAYGTTDANVWKRCAGKLVIPADWSFALPHVGYNSLAAQNFYVAYPYWGRSAQGADITGENTALNTINVGSQTAAELVADAANAKASSASALSAISIIVSDGYLGRSEKPAIIKEWQVIDGEYATISARATSLGLGAHAATASWSAASAALASYLTGRTPAWADTGVDTPIVSATFRGKFTDYYYARQLLLDLFTASIKATADVAVASAATKARIYYQDTVPAAPNAEDMWVRPTAKDWFRWTGTEWVSMLGQFASVEQITAANVAALIGAAVIGDAYIANLNAGKITTGLLSNSRLEIDGLTLSNSGGMLVVGDGGVNTQQLAANAAVTFATYDQVGTFACSSVYANITLASAVAQVTLTNSSPYPATIVFAATLNAYQSGSDSDSVNVRLMRGAIPLAVRSGLDVSGSSSRATTLSLQWTVTIDASATETFTLQASSNDSTTIRAVVIHATLYKRA